MMRIFPTALFIFFLLSCGSSSSSSSRPVNPHAQAHQQMHEELQREEFDKEINRRLELIAGSYKGKLPCADCEGIEFELTLNADLSYVSKRRYVGKSEEALAQVGTYTLSDDWVVRLDQNATNYVYFRKDGDRLKVLDKNGRAIEGDLEEMYVLYPAEL